MNLSSIGLVRFLLRMCEPGGVTVPAPPGRDTIALAVDRDVSGRPHLPATTIAGGLRDLVRSYTSVDAANAYADALFGRLLDKDPTRPSVDAVASTVWVLGTALLDNGQPDPADHPHRPAQLPHTTVRVVTAIDRERGAARTSTLHGEEVLPAGTRFEVYLRWDNPADTDLHTFLAELSRWRPLIGHAVTRGRGRCVVDEVHHGILDLTRPADLATWLRYDGPELVHTVATAPPPHTYRAAPAQPAWLAIEAQLRGPLHIGAGHATPEKPGGPTVARLLRQDAQYLVPGSALKGTLRSRCEYILRSLGAHPDPCLTQQCRICWPCQVFGHGGGNDPTAQAVGRRAQLRVRDAPVATDHPPVRRTHVAVDRFTGGAKDGNLFTVEALESGRFTIQIELLHPHTQHADQIRAMLRLALADLDDGLIGIGGATTRGYGSIAVDLAEAERTGALPTLEHARHVLATLITPPRIRKAVEPSWTLDRPDTSTAAC